MDKINSLQSNITVLTKDTFERPDLYKMSGSSLNFRMFTIGQTKYAFQRSKS